MKQLLSEKRKQLLIDYKINGNKNALEELILSFLNIIENIIAKYENQGLEHDELISIAIETIIRTINNFDYNKDIFTLNSYIDILINKRIKSQLKMYKQNNLSYEQYASTHKNGEDGTTYDTMFEDYVENIRYDLIEKQLDTLTKKEAEIIRWRFGLKDGEERTLDEVGKIFGVSGEAIRQYQNKALRKLRHPVRSKKLKFLLNEKDC